MIDEPGSDLAAQLWDRADAVISSRLIYPEARAAAAAAARQGRIDSRTLRAAVETIDGLCGEMRMIGLDAALAQSAGDLAEAYGLRGYDAVHLASALGTDVEALLVATWDRDLARAAVAAGCAVAPVPAER